MAVSLLFSSISVVGANELVKEESQNYTIKSSDLSYIDLATSKQLGKSTITSDVSLNGNEINVEQKYTTILNDGEIETKIEKSKLILKDNSIIFNGNELKLGDELDNIGFEIPQSDLDKTKPLADKLNAGEISYEEYRESVLNMDLESLKDYNTNNISTFALPTDGGLNYVTYYYASARGGYFMKAAEMKKDLSINSIMLDIEAVKPNTWITKHNYTNSTTGGEVRTFMGYANELVVKRGFIIAEMVLLGSSLGVAVITAPTFIGLLSGGSAASASAIAIMATSTSAHSDIALAYDHLKNATNQ